MAAIDYKLIAREAQLELARRDLFSYAQVKAPDFYKEDRKFQKEMCNALQDFIDDEEDVLVINAPPRHGKSRTAQIAVEWYLGKDKTLKIMTGSYNERLATHFSKGVRDTVSEKKVDPEIIVYSDIFPDTKIQEGDAAMSSWSLEGGYTSYLATSPKGTATGFGADILIIDDLIKNAYEANNAIALEEHWSWFANTMLSRLEAGGKIILIMTRWHSKDLAGRVMEEMPALGYKVKTLIFKAVQDNGSMLCDEILPKDEYEKKVKAMGPDIAAANYQQEPIDLKGRLYTSLKTYDDIPRDQAGNPLFETIKMYSDTADTGDDYLCNIVYGVYQKEAYILDVLYTKAPMEETEPATAEMCIRNNVNITDIESNSGGRGFARAVKNELRKRNYNRTRVSWFHQSKNKQARILTNSTWVMDHIYFPVNWRDRWPDFFTAIYEYQREGKNLHDDGPDALTGVAEMVDKRDRYY